MALGQQLLFTKAPRAAPATGLRITSLQSGSAGNATLVAAGGTAILIDCGLSPARLKERLAPLGLAPHAIAAAFITHEHADHAGAAGALARHLDVALYMTDGTARGTSGRILKTARQRESVRPLPASGRLALRDGKPVALGAAYDLEVSWVPVPHDAREPVAFAVERKGVRFGVLTDLGYPSRAVRRWFATLDAVALETNHDRTLLDEGPYPMMLKRRIASRRGHLSNEQAAELLREDASPRLSTVFLAHLSAENNRPELAEDAVREALGARPDLEVAVHHTRRDAATATVEL